MSRLRITGGRARGRSLVAPVRQGVRPTSSRVREAVFSIIGQDLTGVRFLDACAGSGIMSAEAWSRGAIVTALEVDRRTTAQLRRSLEELGAAVEVRQADARRLPTGTWDVAFVDPPYALDPAPFLEALSGRATAVYLEADGRREPLSSVGLLTLERVRRFGDTALWTYRSGG